MEHLSAPQIIQATIGVVSALVSIFGGLGMQIYRERNLAEQRSRAQAELIAQLAGTRGDVIIAERERADAWRRVARHWKRRALKSERPTVEDE